MTRQTMVCPRCGGTEMIEVVEVTAGGLVTLRHGCGDRWDLQLAPDDVRGSIDDFGLIVKARDGIVRHGAAGHSETVRLLRRRVADWERSIIGRLEVEAAA